MNQELGFVSILVYFQTCSAYPASLRIDIYLTDSTFSANAVAKVPDSPPKAASLVIGLRLAWSAVLLQTSGVADIFADEVADTALKPLSATFSLKSF